MKKFLIISAIPFIFSNSTFAYTGEVVKTYPLPCSFPTGLTFDGKYLWLADRKEDKIFCINPDNGKVIRSIKTPGYWPMGLAWDGKTLWNADLKGGIPLAENFNSKIYQLDPQDGTILKTIDAPSKSVRGLMWDGKYLWCVDNQSDEIIQFSPQDGTSIKTLKAPSVDAHGLAYDGKYLWSSDRIKNKIYMIDVPSGCVIITTNTPGPYTTALAYDGKFLWAVDYQYDKLYKLSVNDDEKFKTDNERKAKVTYTYQITNYGPGKIKSFDVHLAIPTNRDNQVIVGDIEYSPQFTSIVTDRWGQKTAHFNIKDMPAGTMKNITMLTTVTSYDIRYFIYPEKVGTLADIPSEIKNKYLEDNEKYQIMHQVIQDAVKEAVGDEKNPYWIARKIYNYVIDKISYEMVGGWNTAPTVLSRGTGSCSEYSFVFISICRAADLPARYIGSVAVRGDDASMDEVFHRWVEVYLPNYGWIPVDPSGGDSPSPADQNDAFGFLSNRFLITTQGGGGSETMEWTYNSNKFFTTEPQTNVNIEHFADWEPIK